MGLSETSIAMPAAKNQNLSSSGLTYLITGASRGIGLAIVETLIARPDTTVIAAVRDPKTSASAFDHVSKGSNSKLIVIKIDVSIDTDSAAAAKELTTHHGVSHIDVLVSNAAILDASSIVPTLDTPIEAVRKHMEINALAPLLLVQAFMPLLLQSASPKFLAITSSSGSITLLDKYPMPFFAYGVSKAALNYLVRKLALENPNLVSIAYSPGWVQTDMGNRAAIGVGVEKAPLTLEESVAAVVKRFDEADKEKSGKFFSYTGESLPW